MEKRDDSERKAYFQEFHEKQQELSRQRQQVENRLEGMYGVERRLEQADRESAQLQRELQALREREETLSREFQNSVDQKYEKEVQRIKRKLANQMEEYFEEARPALKRVLKEKRNSYAALFQDLLAQSINAQLDEKKKEYEEYETLRSKANYEKEELLAQKKRLKDRAGELLNRSQALLEKVGGIRRSHTRRYKGDMQLWKSSGKMKFGAWQPAWFPRENPDFSTPCFPAWVCRWESFP